MRRAQLIEPQHLPSSNSASFAGSEFRRSRPGSNSTLRAEFLFGSSKQPEPADTAIGENIESHVRDGSRVQDLVFKEMARMRL